MKSRLISFAVVLILIALFLDTLMRGQDIVILRYHFARGAMAQALWALGLICASIEHLRRSDLAVFWVPVLIYSAVLIYHALPGLAR